MKNRILFCVLVVLCSIYSWAKSLDQVYDIPLGTKDATVEMSLENKGIKGQWELTPKPEKEGDILVFDGNTWKVVNLLDLIKANSKCLWKINDRHQLIPDESVIRNIDSDFNGEISTRGAIYSGE
jgi:hypothetical protein